MEMSTVGCDFDLNELDDIVGNTKNSFMINNKRVWMCKKPEFLEKMDERLRRDFEIPEEQKSIVSLFHPYGELWPIDFTIKKEKYDSTVLVSVADVKDLQGRCYLNRMSAKLFYPKDIIYNFKVNGCIIMFDYIKQDYVDKKKKEREEMEEAKMLLTT